MNEFVELSVQQIAAEMGVSVRTVYSHIEKEGWKKKEGARGRVWYLVPSQGTLSLLRRATAAIPPRSCGDQRTGPARDTLLACETPSLRHFPAACT